MRTTALLLLRASATWQRSDAVRLSALFVPTLRPEQLARAGSRGDAAGPSLELLLRGGYIRQSSAGVYTLLPLGLRIVHRLQHILHDEMHRIGACRLEMPTLLSAALWRKTGRWEAMRSELYRLRDRRGSEWLLGPTHEEEVTRLVSDDVHSGRALPVRVFQITTKHRDEPRPRSGLLRTRAFLMKDLYTFDASPDDAAATYDLVRAAYARIFDRILHRHAHDTPALSHGWIAAEADTGAIGGQRSHEYHMVDPAGEDLLLACTNTPACTYAANVERATSLPSTATPLPHTADEVDVHLFGPPPTSSGKGAAHLITGGTLHAVVVRSADVLNDIKVAHALNPASPSAVRLFPTGQAGGVTSATDHGPAWDWADRPEGPLVRFSRLDILLDHACSSLEQDDIEDAVQRAVVAYASSRPAPSPSPPPPPSDPSISTTTSTSTDTDPDPDPARLSDFFPTQLHADPALPSTAAQLPIRHADVRTAEAGDTCVSCRAGVLEQHRAVEVGHTFLLGTRYSDALGVGFVPVSGGGGGGGGAGGGRVPFQMGCYGIGVTRLVGVLAQRAAAAFEATQQRQRQHQQQQQQQQRQKHDAEPGRKEGKDAAPSAGLLWPPSVAPFRALIVLAAPITPDKERAVAALVARLTAPFHQGQGQAQAQAPAQSQGQAHAEEDTSTPAPHPSTHALDAPLPLPLPLDSTDILIDDRPHPTTLGTKLRDADLIGAPVVYVLGRRWAERGEVEVRRAGEEVAFEPLGLGLGSA